MLLGATPNNTHTTPTPAPSSPERWLEMEHAPSPYSAISFHAGPRICLGQRLAELEGVFVLVGARRGSALLGGGCGEADSMCRAPRYLAGAPQRAAARCNAKRPRHPPNCPPPQKVLVLQRFKLSLVPGQAVTYDLSASHPMKSGCWVNVAER